jgi:hypothetical protein
MGARLGVDELAGDAEPLASLAHAAFQHVTHAQLAADLTDVDGLVPGDRSAGPPMNIEIYLKEIGDVHTTSQVTPTNTLGIAMTRCSALIKLAVQRS